MNANPSPHPTDETLHAYGLGKLDDVSAEAVNAHLESCDPCRRRTAQMSSDSFLGRLQAGQKPDGSNSGLGPPVKPRGDGSAASLPEGTLPPGLAEHPDYDVIRELGRGGMGVVYLAKNRLLGRDEVLKVMARHMMERPSVLERFLREIRAVARLRHPNIVAAYHAFRIDKSLVFAMEYVEGFDLSQMVKARGPLPVAHACLFAHQAALGLQHACDEGMVHRDIKPGNLMVTRRGNKGLLKILDFGLSKAAREGEIDSGLTHQGQMLGTPDFIAPEQSMDAQSADIRADVYSLGCTLYCLLTGAPPFRGTSLAQILQAHQSTDAKMLNFVRPEVPEELAAIVAKMMAKEPSRRYRTPSEVSDALAPFFKKGGVTLKPPKAEVSGIPAMDTSGVAPKAKATPVPVVSSTTTAPPPGKLSDAHRPEAMWSSLIDFREPEPTVDDDAIPDSEVASRPIWVWPAVAAGVLLCGFALAWAAGFLKPGESVASQSSQTNDDGTPNLPASESERNRTHTGQLPNPSGEPSPQPKSIPPLLGKDLQGSPVFNGKNFEGWEGRSFGQPIDPSRIYRIEAGELVFNGTNGGIRLAKTFETFSFTFDYLIPNDGRDGRLQGDVSQPTVAMGQADELPIRYKGVNYPVGALRFILGDCKHISTQENMQTGDILPTMFKDPDKEVFICRRKVGAQRPSGSWNSVEVRVQNRIARFILNGLEVNRVEADRSFPSYLALGSFGTDIRFRNIRLLQLAANADGYAALSVGDTLQPGTVWIGERSYRKGAWAGGTVTYELHIRERIGAKFIGHKFDCGPRANRCEITGEVHGSEITWVEKDDREGVTSVFNMRGALVEDTIKIGFTGAWSNGAFVEGDAKLTLQKIGNGGPPTVTLEPTSALGTRPSMPTASAIPTNDGGTKVSAMAGKLSGLLTPGSIWVGRRTYINGAWAGGTSTSELHVEERMGLKFTGYVFHDGEGRNRGEVEGEVNGDTLTWRERVPARDSGYVLTGAATLREQTPQPTLQNTFRAVSSQRFITEGDGQWTRTVPASTVPAK